ncbi:MAG TPA: hypothetical protein VEK08_19495 [Planctomycetota bacterium]|nr:hypothetical protein [Planctomycetota bacterium]
MKSVASLLVAFLIAVLSAPSSAYGEELPQAWSVVPFLPDDTLIVVQARDGRTLATKAATSGLGKIIALPETQRAAYTYFSQLRFYQSVIEIQLGRRLSDMAALYGSGELTLALTDIKVLEGGTVLPEIIVAAALGEKGIVAFKEMEARLERLRSIAGGQMTQTRLPTGEVTVTRVAVPGLPFSLSYALCDGTFLLSSADGRLEKLLARRFELKEAGKLNTPARGTLVAQPSYIRALQRIGSASDLHAFINSEKLYGHALLSDLQKKKDSGGFGSVRGITYSLSIGEKSFDESAFFDVPAAQRKGALSLFATGTWEPMLNAHSSAALAGLSLNIPPDRLLRTVFDVIEESDPEARAAVDARLRELSAAAGVDVAGELARTLLDHMALSVSIPSRHPRLALGFPGVIFTCRVRDLAGFTNLLQKVRDNCGKLLEFTKIPDPGGDITIIRPRPTVENPQPVQFVFTLRNEELLVSLTPLSLRDELQRRALLAEKAPGAAPNLFQDSAFQQQRQSLGPAGQALIYVDVPALFTAFYQTAVPYLQFQKRENAFGLNPWAFPTVETFTQNLSSLLVSVRADDEGITVRGSSPIGVLPYLAVLPSIEMVREITGKSHDVSAEQERANLEKIGKAIARFAAANGAKFPRVLKDLRQYAPELDPSVFDRYVYRGALDADNAVIAHTPTRQKGPIAVLLQDGRALVVPRRGFKTLLAEGYKK